jgi:hypothetical protein
MVQLGLDAKGLTTLGKMLHLPLARTDTGYLVHCALGELFQDDAPQPFSIENEAQNGRRVRVLGYTAADADTLQANAQLDASPTVYERQADAGHLSRGHGPPVRAPRLSRRPQGLRGRGREPQRGDTNLG